MSKILFSVLSALMIGLFSQVLAQEANEQVPEWQLGFDNLAPEAKKEYQEHLFEASRLFQQKRIFESLDALSKAEKIYTDNPNALNLKGACYVEFRDFPSAKKHFSKALALTPDSTDIHFNIAEIDFVTKQWSACEESLMKVITLATAEIEDLETLIAQKPSNQTLLTIKLRERESIQQLSEFKLFLSKIRLNKDEDVKELANRYTEIDDTPYYYYVQASLAYENDDREKAEEWISRAQRVFVKNELLGPWQDSLIEFGYIRSFYGGDLEAPATPTTP